MGDKTRRWRRSIAVAVASCALVALAAITAGPSSAQQAGGAGNGVAKATAVLGAVSPGVGGVDLGIKTGISVAETTNNLAQAQSQSADFGLIGTSLTAESCGDDGTLRPEDLPQPVRVDNTEGASSDSKDEVPLGPVGGFRLGADATLTPSASASATGAGLDAPGLVTISGGRSVAEAQVVDGGREARARVEASIDFAGVLELSGMRWDALHRTGADRSVQGSFLLGSAAVGGVPLPVEELAPAQSAINEALRFTGIRVELPRVVELTEPTDLVRVTPLRIEIRESELGATALGPILNASREQREQFFQALGEAICDLKSFLLVADVGIAIGSGSGFLTVDIGGVEALSGDFVVGDEIGIPESVLPVAPGSGAAAPGAATGGGSGVVPTEPDATAAPGPGAGTPTQPAAASSPLEKVCESVHPFEWPSCSEGAAPAAGVLGLLATGAMVGLDVRRQRRTDAAGGLG